MPCIYLISGPCGCGKSTLTNVWSAHLIATGRARQAYVIHGDDSHRALAETPDRVGPDCPGFLYWPDVLPFIWDCMLSTAHHALQRGLDVLIDYVVEDELPRVEALARLHHAHLCFVVLTADEATLRQRLIHRGSSHLIERSLFLRQKFLQEPIFAPHLADITGMTLDEEIVLLEGRFHLPST